MKINPKCHVEDLQMKPSDSCKIQVITCRFLSLLVMGSQGCWAEANQRGIG